MADGRPHPAHALTPSPAMLVARLHQVHPQRQDRSARDLISGAQGVPSLPNVSYYQALTS